MAGEEEDGLQTGVMAVIRRGPWRWGVLVLEAFLIAWEGNGLDEGLFEVNCEKEERGDIESIWGKRGMTQLTPHERLRR